LDEAIASVDTQSGPLRDITPDSITNLAAIKQLKAITGMEIIDLLPLWGDIGPTLSARLFLSRRLQVYGSNPNNTKQALFAFTKDGGGQLFTSGKFSDNMTVVLAALRLSSQEFAAIKTHENIDDNLTLPNLSALYRVSMFSKLLGITPLQYPDFAQVFGYVASDPSSSLLASPSTTLSVVTDWENLQNAGWTFPQLLFVVGNKVVSPNQPSPSLDTLFRAAATLISGLGDIESTYPDYPSPSARFPPEKTTAEYVTKISTLILDTAVVPVIVQFLEGRSFLCLVIFQVLI
jgi:hypothetical protein